MVKRVYPLDVSGHWRAELTDEFGNLKQVVEGDNVITESGLDFIASFLYSATTAATFTMLYVAIGTDSTTAYASNTALGVEAARHTGTAGSSGAVYTVAATFAAGVGTGAIVEYGLFSSNTAGTLFSRDVESVVNKGAGDTLTVTAEYTFS